VDWNVILGSEIPVPRVVDRSVHGKLAALLAAFDEILALEEPDAVLRRAAQLALERIGLMRVGIFLLDRQRNAMLGTWGTDIAGTIVDEHHIMYDASETDREAFRRAEEEGAHFTVFENCPIVEHHKGETRVIGRGWVACTPIRSTRAPIGMMFNDTGISGEAVDEAKQAHAAILCSLLGTILDPVRGSLGHGPPTTEESSSRRLVTSTVAMLAKDPAMGGKQIAAKLASAGSPACSRRRWGCRWSSTGTACAWIASRCCSIAGGRTCSRRRWRRASAATRSFTASSAPSAT